MRTVALRGATTDAGLRRGYTEEAVAAIRKGIADGWQDLERLRTDPDLDPIRDAPEFRRLLEEPQGATKQAPAT